MDNNTIDWTMLAIVVVTIFATAVAVSIGIGFALNKFYKLGTFAQRLENLEADVAEQKQNLDSHNELLTSIITALLQKDNDMDSFVSQKVSPRRLNPLGEKLLAMMNGKEFLLDNKEALFCFIDAQKPKATFDFESVFMMACVSLLDTDAFLPIKKFVYNCPAQKMDNGDELDVTLGVVCYILAFPLRDMYLEEHPELI